MTFITLTTIPVVWDSLDTAEMTRLRATVRLQEAILSEWLSSWLPRRHDLDRPHLNRLQHIIWKDPAAFRYVGLNSHSPLAEKLDTVTSTTYQRTREEDLERRKTPVLKERNRLRSQAAREARTEEEHERYKDGMIEHHRKRAVQCAGDAATDERYKEESRNKTQRYRERLKASMGADQYKAARAEQNRQARERYKVSAEQEGISVKEYIRRMVSSLTDLANRHRKSGTRLPRRRSLPSGRPTSLIQKNRAITPPIPQRRQVKPVLST